MKYGLIGGKLGHSYSREIHQKIANYDYELMELAPEELDTFMRTHHFTAINVTIPYKQAVIPYLTRISDDARRIGAVNTILNKCGSLYGYNTDFAGMCSTLSRANIGLRGKKVLILGTGGTSKTASAVAVSLGAREIRIVSRTQGNDVITYENAVKEHTDAEIIINATPSGMFPKMFEKPIDIAPFKNLEGIMDAIYNPLRSELVMDGLKRGIPSVGGLYMLSAQAIHAASHFMGVQLKERLFEETYIDILAEKQNIVLIGMAGSGKTTIGQAVAEKTGKRFIDTDAEIVERAGMSISDIFAKFGEAEFRRMEHEVIHELASVNSSVISTGGGAVLDPANVDALRKNGAICFIDRPPEALTYSDDRPLSTNREQSTKLYHDRLSIYRSAADYTVSNTTTIENAVNAASNGAKYEIFSYKRS